MSVLKTALMLALLAAPAWAQGPNPVGANRAAALFDSVCGKTLPSFAAAKRTLAANGFTGESRFGTSTIYSLTENASFKVLNEGGERTCSFVFVSPAGQGQMIAAFETITGNRFSDLKATPITRYQDKTAIVLLSGPERRNGENWYRALMVTADQ